MAMLKVLVAGLWATSAIASPWSRNQKRGDGWKKHDGHRTKTNHHDTTEVSPVGYGSTSEGGGWGYGTSSTCSAQTVTETSAASTVYITKEQASTVYVTGMFSNS